MYNSIFIDEFDQKEKKEKLSVLDVREADEYQRGHIPSSVNVPLSELARRTDELDKTAELYVICQSGARSAMACDFLSRQGFSVVNVMGGMSAWRGALVS